MILSGARVALGATDSLHTDVLIRRGRIFAGRTAAYSPRTPRIDLNGFLILPGLINAHDHLEFNLFPRLGHGPYPNAAAWAGDIYRPHDPLLRRHCGVPKPVRLFWGGVKNLLSGATTVAHHNPYQADVFDDRFPVRVLKRYGWAHSLEFSPDWRERFRLTPRGAPFIIHAAEGCDGQARREIYQLDTASALCRSTVLVHGVALRTGDLPLLRKRRASLIWCPSSNYFTLGQSIAHEFLRSRVPIALGTDSALTAEGDLIDELRTASQFVDPVRLYKMVTTGAARILRLHPGAGSIRNGGIADLVVVADLGRTPAEALIGFKPELVFLNGRIHLASIAIAHRLPASALDGFQPIAIENRGCWLTPFPVSRFASQAKQALGENLCLAGKKVIA